MEGIPREKFCWVVWYRGLFRDVQKGQRWRSFLLRLADAMSLLLAKAMGPTHMLCGSLVPTKEMIMSCPPKDIIKFCGHFCSYFWPWLGLLSVHSNLFSLYSESELPKWSARFWLLCSKYYFKYQRVMFCCCSPLFLQLKTLSKVNSNGPLSSLTIFKRPAVGN